MDDMGISATLVVNERDVVPRLLGSSPTILKTFFDLLVSATRNIGLPTASLRQIVHKSVEISSKYVHPEGLELVVLKGRKAFVMPEHCHHSWSSLDSSLKVVMKKSLLTDHSVEEKYVKNLVKNFWAHYITLRS